MNARGPSIRPTINQIVSLPPRFLAIDRITTAHPISITKKTINMVTFTI